MNNQFYFIRFIVLKAEREYLQDLILVDTFFIYS